MTIKRKYIRVPATPTKAMLRAMSRATYLTDGSDLEMHRRFNGLMDAVSKHHRRVAKIRKRTKHQEPAR